MKNVTLILMLLIILIHQKSFSITPQADQFRPLCVDLARRLVTEKVKIHAHHQKRDKKNLRTTASKKQISFQQIPIVISSNSDIKMAKLILQSARSKKEAKTFKEKLQAEDKLFSGIGLVLSDDQGENFLSQCSEHLVQSQKKCEKFIGKDFAKFNSCLSQSTSDDSIKLTRFIPFVAYKLKSRELASKNRVEIKYKNKLAKK